MSNPINVALAIDILVPAAQYGGSVTANTEQQYNKIRWEDERTQPTWAIPRYTHEWLLKE